MWYIELSAETIISLIALMLSIPALIIGIFTYFKEWRPRLAYIGTELIYGRTPKNEPVIIAEVSFLNGGKIHCKCKTEKLQMESNAVPFDVCSECIHSDTWIAEPYISPEISKRFYREIFSIASSVRITEVKYFIDWNEIVIIFSDNPNFESIKAQRGQNFNNFEKETIHVMVINHLEKNFNLIPCNAIKPIDGFFTFIDKNINYFDVTFEIKYGKNKKLNKKMSMKIRKYIDGGNIIIESEFT